MHSDYLDLDVILHAGELEAEMGEDVGIVGVWRNVLGSALSLRLLH